MTIYHWQSLSRMVRLNIEFLNQVIPASTIADALGITIEECESYR